MEFLILLLVVLVVLLFIGATLMLGGMITTLLDVVLQGRRCGGGTGEADDALHAQRVLAHFETMRDAVLAGDDERLRRLEDELLELDAAAWADYRTQLRKGAKRAGITFDVD